MAKPNRKTVMLDIIETVKTEFPLDAPEASICGDTCVGCPRKLLELVEGELLYWESQLKKERLPDFGELNRFGRLCKNVRRGLVRNGLIEYDL